MSEGRFTLPKTAEARRWVKSTDSLRISLQQQQATLRTTVDKATRELERVDGALSLLNQLLPAKTQGEPSGVTEVVRWSRNFEKCQSCGGTDTPHLALGYCKTCYPKRLKVA